MKLAIEIEEICDRINQGKDSLFSVIESYENKLEDYDEDKIESLEGDVSIRETELSKCVDEIERLADILRENKIEFEPHKTNKIIRSARFYIND